MSLFERYMKEKGLKSSTELDHMTSLYLVNDHPALSFPNLTLPNCLNIASLNYKTPKTLLKIADFLKVCEKTFVALGKLGHTAHNSRLKKGDNGRNHPRGVRGTRFLCYDTNLNSYSNKNQNAGFLNFASRQYNGSINISKFVS